MLSALLIVGVAAPAYAQALDVGRLMGAGSLKKKTQDEVDAEKQRNDDYSAAIKKLPDQNVKSDPWGTMRGSGGDQKQSAPKQKQAKPKPSDQKQQATGAQ
jgi:hypothetical protein